MAGTLEVSTIKSGAANTLTKMLDSASAEMARGATCWAIFTGTTGAEIATFNCSVVRDAVATYHLVPDTDFSDANITITGGGDAAGTYAILLPLGTQTTTAANFKTYSFAGAGGDNTSYVMAVVHGGRL